MEKEKFNIENTETIDGIAFEEETSKLILLLADGMDWTNENHMLLLQSKLNSYIGYIDTEQYLEKYDKVKTIEIQIKFLFKEPEICNQFLERVKEKINELFNNVIITVEHGTK